MTPAALSATRRVLGLTIADAARFAGVERRTWDRWENGERAISLPVVALVTLWRDLPGALEYSRANRVADNKEDV